MEQPMVTPEAVLDRPVDRKGIWGWMLFDWAAQPFHTLLLTFIFSRYFATEVAPDSATGQAWWGYMLGISGILVALMSPVLGAIADATGPRKPWIAFFSLFAIIGASYLWNAVPGGGPETFWVLVAFGLAFIGFEFATVFNNAVMPTLVPRERLGRLSGNSWAIGYIGGIVSLLIILCLFVQSRPGSGVTLIGLEPVFGLAVIPGGGERAAGPLTALWYAFFTIPFFLFTPDSPRMERVRGVIANGLRELLTTLKRLPSNRSLFAYLGSSMFYRDALNGLFGFGGVYAGGVLKWEATQLGLFGILAAITGALGAWYGGRVDDSKGPKFVVIISVIVLIAASLAIVTTDRSTVLLMAVEPADGFFTLPDIVFYVVGALIGAAGGSLQASSRTLLVHQADPARMTEAFGLYALSGKATSFMAPLLIAVFTEKIGLEYLQLETIAAQRFGISPILLLFLVGLALLPLVKVKRVES
jgi:UMF1 family MFS transporter